MKRSTTIAAVVLLLSYVGISSADTILVSVESKSLTTTGTGFVDVSISSGSFDSLDSVNYEFVITRLTGPGFLHFIATNADDLLNDSNYIFSGVSTLTPGSPYGSSSLTSYPDDTFIGSDSTQLDGSGNPTNVPVPDPGHPRLWRGCD